MFTDEIQNRLQAEITELLQENIDSTEQPSDFNFTGYTNSITGEPEGGQVCFSYNGQTHCVNISPEGELDGEIVFVTTNDTENEVEGSTPEGAETEGSQEEVTNPEDPNNENSSSMNEDPNQMQAPLSDERDEVLEKIKSYMASDEYKAFLASEVDNYMSKTKSMGMGNEVDLKKSADAVESPIENQEENKQDETPTQEPNQTSTQENPAQDEPKSDEVKTDETINEEVNNQVPPEVKPEEVKEESGETEYEKAYQVNNPYGLSPQEYNNYFPSTI